MATNDFLPFASTDTGTNLLTQAEYLADTQRTIGNQSGVARAKLVNKAQRQSSFISAVVAKYISDTSAVDTLDNGDLSGMATKLATAIQTTAAGSSSVAGQIHAATAKTAPVDLDEFGIVDTASSNVLKKLTWANLKATFMSSIGLLISGLTARSTPIDADVFVIGDSSSTFASKSLTFLNLKATLLTYFDTLYSRTSAIFGVGQTWQNMTGSRSSGSTYTNSTGKVIFVFVTTNSDNGSSFSVGGGVIGKTASYATTSGAPIPVQAGATYSFTLGSGSITLWYEFR